MPGSFNDILSEPISHENEIILQEHLRRKMAGSLGLAVDILHAMEKRFGVEAREVIRDMAANHEFQARQELAEPQADLRSFCSMLDRGAVGSHHWERVIDQPDRIGYCYTSCMYADILRELGEPELGLVICSGDAPWVKSFNPALGFRRTKTLMEGDDECNHEFIVESLLTTGCGPTGPDEKISVGVDPVSKKQMPRDDPPAVRKE
jgi:hypothetical protein